MEAAYGGGGGGGPPVAQARVVTYDMPSKESVVVGEGVPPQPVAAVGVVAGTIVGPGFGDAYQIRDENALAAPGYDSYTQPARDKSCASKALYAVILLVVVGAAAVLVVVATASGDGDEPTAPVVSQSADTSVQRCVDPPPVANGRLEVNVQVSVEGLPTEPWSDGWYVGHAAEIACNTGFALPTGVSDTAICFSNGGWMPKTMPSCESTAPPAPVPIPVPVAPQVFSSPAEVQAAVSEISRATYEGAPTVQIASSVAFPVAIESVAEGTPARRDFESGFVSAMARELGGVDEEAITVNSVTAGSVIVDWTLTAPYSRRDEAASLVTTLADPDNGAELVITIAARPVAADMRSITDPVATREENVDCVGAWTACEEGCADKTFLVATVASGSGWLCEADHGATSTCRVGDGACTTPVEPNAPGGVTPPGSEMQLQDADYCLDSPEQTCSRRCGTPQCPLAGQCAMRTDSQCCEVECVDPTPGLPPPPVAECPASSTYTLVDSGQVSHTELAADDHVFWCLRCTTPGEVAQLTFADFDIEYNFDFLYLYDSPGMGGQYMALHGQYYQNEEMHGTISASGPEAFVEYTADGSVNGQGFDATFSCGVDDGISWEDNSGGGLQACLDGDSVIDTGSVSHTSPSDDQECTWALSCSNRLEVVSLTFDRFDLEYNFDFVYLYNSADDSGPYAQLHGDSVAPSTYHSSGPVAFVKFTSDGSVHAAGFTASFDCVDRSTVTEATAWVCLQGDDCGGQEYSDSHTPCPLVCGSPSPPPSCSLRPRVAEFQCPDGMWWDAYTRRHSDTTSWQSCDEACHAPPSTEGAADAGVCYEEPEPCPGCFMECDSQMDWWTADDNDWVRYAACARMCTASIECAESADLPDEMHECDSCMLPCDQAMNWDSEDEQDWAQYGACSRACQSDDACDDWYGDPEPCDQCVMDCDANMNWASPTNSEWMSWRTCEEACHSDGAACDWSAGMHPCSACLAQCDEDMWANGWDLDDSDWEAYEACQGTCHDGDDCEQPEQCVIPSGQTTSAVSLVDSGVLTHVPFNTQECTWSMRCTDPSLQVLLEFSEFDLESGYDYLYLYNGATLGRSSNPDVQLHGTGLPDSWLGVSYAATAQYVSDSSVDGAGFTASFSCVEGSTVPPPPPNPCATGGVSLSNSGNIYHARLDNGQECQWTLICDDATLSPLITFTGFDTEQSFDFLYLFDGTDIQAGPSVALHGSDLPADWVATANVAVALYESDDSVNRDGFSAVFSCADASTVPPPPADPCGAGVSIVDHGEVYHGELEDAQDCSWRLSCSDPSEAVTLVFASFDIEQGWDYLYIYDAINTMGEPAATLHGSSVPSPFTASGPVAVVRYQSDWSISGDGFTAAFSCVDPSTVPPPPPDPCAGDGVELVDAGAIFHGLLQDNQACTWSMSCSDSSHVPQVWFSAFDIETRYDFLYLFDGDFDGDFDGPLQPAATLHGSIMPEAFTATQTVATAVYTSDGSVQREGFSASFACVLPGTAAPPPPPAPPGVDEDNVCDVCMHTCDLEMNWHDPSDADWGTYSSCQDGCWGITGVCNDFYRDPCETCIAQCQELVPDWDYATAEEIAAYEECEGSCFVDGGHCAGWEVDECDECFWNCEEDVDFSDEDTDWATVNECQDRCYETGNACHDPCRLCVGECWDGAGASLVQTGACVPEEECPGGGGPEGEPDFAVGRPFRVYSESGREENLLAVAVAACVGSDWEMEL
jgi:hypothetical protein